MTTQLAQQGKAQNIAFAPDGSQAAILTTGELPHVDTANFGNQPALLLDGGELRLVNTNDGSVEFILPIQIKDNFLEYSPDGKYVIGLAYDSIVRVNVKDGTWEKITLNYTTEYGTLPKFTWVDNSTILVPITNPPNPDANFTIWRVSLTDVSAQPVQTFFGDISSVIFSPDGNYLSFRKPIGQPLIFSLANLNTGNILATLEANDFVFWSPNSDYYVYGQRVKPESGNDFYKIQVYAGQIGKEPVLLGSILQLAYYGRWLWVDAERFVLDADCGIRLFSVSTTVHEITIIP